MVRVFFSHSLKSFHPKWDVSELFCQMYLEQHGNQEHRAGRTKDSVYFCPQIRFSDGAPSTEGTSLPPRYIRKAKVISLEDLYQMAFQRFYDQEKYNLKRPSFVLNIEIGVQGSMEDTHEKDYNILSYRNLNYLAECLLYPLCKD